MAIYCLHLYQAIVLGPAAHFRENPRFEPSTNFAALQVDVNSSIYRSGYEIREAGPVATSERKGSKALESVNAKVE